MDRMIAYSLVVGLLTFLPGCGLKREIDSFRIQGSWVGDKSGAKFVFNSDGTCDINGRQGKYEILDNNRLKVTTKGMLWGENDETVKYSIISSSKIRIDTTFFGFDVSDTFSKK